jgi:hypothetical protein
MRDARCGALAGGTCAAGIGTASCSLAPLAACLATPCPKPRACRGAVYRHATELPHTHMSWPNPNPPHHTLDYTCLMLLPPHRALQQTYEAPILTGQSPVLPATCVSSRQERAAAKSSCRKGRFEFPLVCGIVYRLLTVWRWASSEQ